MTETCSAVLRSRRNCSSDGAERTDDGTTFIERLFVMLATSHNRRNVVYLCPIVSITGTRKYEEQN